MKKARLLRTGTYFSLPPPQLQDYPTNASQKKFTCESTGHTGFTFFEAKESEVRSTPVLEKGSLIVTTPQSEASKEINSILPEALRSRILEYVQFDTTSRMDDLVNDVFDYFREQFMVGDRVSIEGDNARRYGRITAMTDTSRLHNMFATTQSMDDSVRSYSYEVTLDDTDEKVVKYRASEIQRDKSFYSKIIFKQYLRDSTRRGEYVGDPWMVLEHLAKRYGIPTVMPDNQTREAILARRRAANGNVQNGASPPMQQTLLEPVKYPMEDLEIRQPRTMPMRPTLKFFSDDVPDGVEEPADEKKTGIKMKSLGPLLCAWETLNVHDTVYMLDSFTFDDFVDAMRFADEEIDCELFVEVHCSILKQIINGSGKLQTHLPKMAELEESDEEDSSKEATPEPEPPVRTTRSSLRKSEAQQLVKPRTPTPEPPKETHSAEKFLEGFNWVEQCKLRNFRDGGWQSIVVALLYRLSFDPIQKEACEEILARLVPADDEPTMDTIAHNYLHLDVNLRISALDLILRLTVATEAFRDQLIAAAQEMTRLRKEKIDFQRKRKELADELFKLDLERKIHLPANTPASPTETKENEDVDMSMTSIASDAKDTTDADGDGSELHAATKSRLRQSNKNKRKAAAEEARKEKAKKAKQEAEKTKKQKEWEKLLDSIEKKKDELRECEANINELDDDLRETLVHRSKVLGKDRFLNKYYWFEHNGMPFGGVPNSSTAEYGYANGRIWVQGPDEYELQPVLDEPAVSQDRQRFGFDIPQRKKKEEGDTHLTNSTQWAYYDDPEDIDKLLAWLDERGVRERALRKELQIFKDRIAEYMLIMKKHLSEPDKVEEEDDESNTRISTRNKTYVEKETIKDRCLLWTNSIMREENGYNHSEEYEPPKKGKAKPVKAAKAKAKR
ncbi:hypothetical protein SNOG_13873 [Parastagonospora nodorum SN15]|uniref:WAC domain-containing protein n=1 Tax=Phaeosphaeria nodorum (strain SN15 / ATCC MYA-4574 / FGSC 10173) TaxID=321614 RepID=Q0U2Z1_PHANO|nr:hypothetical protein SNOG_13873 [Parastagonospora nodorum SN15]EAT78897.2 hypothetical protein SNOG_13873 [Parastagonospora nodorum SN15]